MGTIAVCAYYDSRRSRRPKERPHPRPRQTGLGAVFRFSRACVRGCRAHSIFLNPKKGGRDWRPLWFAASERLKNKDQSTATLTDEAGDERVPSLHRSLSPTKIVQKVDFQGVCLPHVLRRLEARIPVLALGSGSLATISCDENLGNGPRHARRRTT
eukprot:389547-Rhodomonas_salina.4